MLTTDKSDALMKKIDHFSLPEYREIPNVGLFLDQTVKYIAEYLEPLTGVTLTGSMISNYVKKKIITNPIKKQYNRDQIAYLIFIAIAKNVLSLEDIQTLLTRQQSCCSPQEAYVFFSEEFCRTLRETYDLPADDRKNHLGIETSIFTEDPYEDRIMLEKIIVTAAHKIYLDSCFALIRE